ncbi:hypothetical protein F4604DRAFT_686356 [Suillus subluteus]|nr:hypothetical protein F4604DRAFT_686356 [Suillus subluteus]
MAQRLAMTKFMFVYSVSSFLTLLVETSSNSCRSLPFSAMSTHVAYDISVKGPIDKNDLMDAIIAAKTLTGTLPLSNESHYRAHGIPKHCSSRPRGLFSTHLPLSTHQHTSIPQSHDLPRPDLDPEPASYKTYSQTPSPPQPQPRFGTASQPQTPP